MKKMMVLLAVILVASVAFAQQSPAGQGPTVINGGIPQDFSVVAPGAGPNNLGGPGLGRHDLKNANTQEALGCESCHLPHTAPASTGKAFLWAWSSIPTSITTYVTDTNPAATLTGPIARANAASRSLLCLTCHDSASANANGITGGVLYGVAGPYPMLTTVGGVGDMGTEHPVNAVVPVSIGYQPAAPVAPGSVISATANIGTDSLPLWTNNTVQCATCHDPHNDYTSDQGAAGGVPFLRVANTNGTYLCRECHNQ